MQPKVSVITCTWNSEAFVAETIASVNLQTYRNIEHVFIDGGSSDRTLEIIAEMAPSAVIRHNVRGGISNAMNEGVRAASGDIICHLHSDDYFSDSNVLTDVVSSFDQTGCDWLFARTNIFDGQQIRSPGWLMPEVNFLRLLRGNFIAHPATFLKREVFDRYGLFDTELRYAMDYDLWLRIARENLPHHLDRRTTVFRQHQGSVSSANPLPALAEDFAVRRRHLPAGKGALFVHWLRYQYRRQRISMQPAV